MALKILNYLLKLPGTAVLIRMYQIVHIKNAPPIRRTDRAMLRTLGCDDVYHLHGDYSTALLVV